MSFLLISATAWGDARLEDAHVLGWLPDHSVCEGHFADPIMPGLDDRMLPLKSAPVTITADSSHLEYSGISTLSGQIVLKQPGRFVSADTAHLVTQDGNYLSANLMGHIILREKNKVAIGQQADFDLKNKQYSLKNIIYRFWVGGRLSAWGKAAQAIQPPSDITEFKQVTYSTCPPQSRAWDLHAKHIYMNQQTGRGSAVNAILLTHGIPVLYIPYISFPIDNRRQTGFLYPQFSFGGDSGFGLGLPFYWNIAPNYDDTITPSFYVKRGVMINNVFRYLTPYNNGTINLTVLPNDLEFRRFQQTEYLYVPPNTPGLNALENNSPTRSAVSWIDNSKWDSQWKSSINYNRVGDDYYMENIGGVPVVSQNQLLQQGQVSYKGTNWDFLGNVQSYQTLHPVDQALVLNQYSMLPQLLFSSRYSGDINTLSPSWSAEFVNFEKAPNPGQIVIPPSGQRLNIVPGLALPLVNNEGYVTPSIRLEMTQYNVGDQPVGFSNEITRTVPIVNVDSGLFFERNIHIGGGSYNETLEPRIFYLYVPYHNQDDIPVFDSALQPMTYNQLFLTNRFSGSDRMGDANQVSVGVTTRFFDQKTGVEKLSGSIGIIDYFENRDVTLCQTPGCTDSLYSVGSTSPTASTSPIVGQVDYHLNGDWSILSSAAWAPDIAQMQNANVTFHYEPVKNHIVNLGYNYVRYGDFFLLPGQTAQLDSNTATLNSQYNLSEPTVSFAWPLSARWNLVGSWSYSWNEAHSLTYFSGVQYNTCCWALQTVLSRAYQGLDGAAQPQYSTNIFVQFAFKGFAKFGTDPSGLLLNNIPGYQNDFAAL